MLPLAALVATAAAAQIRLSGDASDVIKLNSALDEGSVVDAAPSSCNAEALENAERAVDAALVAHPAWRWDVASVLSTPACTITLRRQPARHAAFLESYQSEFRNKCEEVYLPEVPGGTYLGNRLNSMGAGFARAALHTEMDVPYVPRGLPNYFHSEAFCGNVSDLECFFLPAGACGLPRARGATLEKPPGLTGRLGGRCASSKGNWTCRISNPTLPCVSRGVVNQPPCVRRAPSHRLCGRREGALFWSVAMRPHAKTRLELRRRIETWLEAHPAWRSTGEACAAIHIRHGDKYTPAWIDKNHPPPTATLKDYVANASKALSIRNATGPMLVMTDDQDIIDELPRVAATTGISLYHVPSARPLASSSEVSSSEIGSINCERSHRDERCIRGPNFNYRRDQRTGQFVGPAELLQFLTTWALASRCRVLVGMRRSYFSHVMFDAMCALGGACPAFVAIEARREEGCAGTEACHVFDDVEARRCVTSSEA